MPLIIPSNSISGEYEVANSLRFDDGSSDYINRTPSGAGNRKTWTFSIWFKRSAITTGAQQKIFSVAGGGSNNFECYFNTNDTLAFYHYSSNGAVTDSFLGTNQVFRDVSAWYHLVLSVDTTQGTASNRVKMYVNGEQVTSFSSSSYFNQNYDTYINSTAEHRIGGNLNGSQYFDGYMSEVVLIDGQQLDPTSFGEFDEDSSVWKPIDVSGLSFGSNGFYLLFENSGALGQDDSGNGNNFTVNNLTSIDQTTDTPTLNYATLNPLVQPGSTTAGATHTFSNGNLTLTGGTSKWIADYGTFAPTQGKWYYEMKLTTYGSPTGSPIRAGWGAVNTIVKDDEVYFYGLLYDFGTGTLWSGNDGSGTSVLTGQTTFTQGDIVGVAVDLTGDEITYYKNGTVTSINGYDYSGTTTSIKSSLGNNNAPYILIYANNSNLVDLNFGNAPFSISSGNSDANGYGNFEYSVPSGYYALNTKNLAEYG